MNGVCVSLYLSADVLAEQKLKDQYSSPLPALSSEVGGSFHLLKDQYSSPLPALSSEVGGFASSYSRTSTLARSWL